MANDSCVGFFKDGKDAMPVKECDNYFPYDRSVSPALFGCLNMLIMKMIWMVILNLRVSL